MLDWKIVALRLLLASLAGAAIGYDRERINQAAGLRTYIVVTNAAALCAMAGIYMSGTISQSDIARLPAAFISGLGFLGAGSIRMGSNREVRGLTTAAGLWASAVTGIAFGAGFYVGAGVSFAISFLAIVFLDGLEKGMDRRRESGNLYCELHSRSDLKDVRSRMDARDTAVSDMKIEKLEGDAVAVTMLLRESGGIDLTDVLREVKEMDGVTFAIFI